MTGAVAIGLVTVGAGAQDIVLQGLGRTSLQQEQSALKAARQQAEDARDRSQRLDQQAGQAREDAERARRHAAAMAARIQEAEADIQMAQARLAIIARLQRAQAVRLAERQEPVVKLTAALQMMARRPLALALVQPGSMTDAVHMRAVLGAVLPVIRERTAGLRAELDRSRALRATAQQAADALTDSRMKLTQRQSDLRALEARKRVAAQALRSDAGLEEDRAVALGERARDIVDLMDQLESAGDLRDRLAALSGPILRPARPDQAGVISGGETPERATAASGPPPYRLPVVGQLVTGMGEVSTSGVRSRGLTLATQPSAQLVAPTAGRIAFAGPYRGYGQILIIDHGQGWTTLLTGLHRLSVNVGETVRQGDPVGIAGSGRPTITIELRRNGRPIDIVPLVGLG
ncbi:murein hydrolase activator EnvC family protein [Sphingobium aromaticiconvertens]|uniref:murein hydrolase activator EnvC family protein n=1 Tax=Sphingobium aromaticiconvertens TaxID=365341 RepID=UPI0030186F7C